MSTIVEGGVSTAGEDCRLTEFYPEWEGLSAIGHLILLDGGGDLAASADLTSFVCFSQHALRCSRREEAEPYLLAKPANRVGPGDLA